MKPFEQVCQFPDLSQVFLLGELSETQQREFESHLDDCPHCRQQLEQAAGKPDCWNEASQFLGDDPFRSSLHRSPMPRSSLYENEDTRAIASAQINQILQSLHPTDDPAMLGRLGSYEVSGVVGSGGMGVVLKAIDRPLDRTVAIKVLSPHLASSGAADSLEDAIKTTSSDYQAALDDNAKSRLLRYLKVDVEAAYENKLEIQEAELYLLLGKVLQIRDEHVAQAANREELVAQRIARLVRHPAAHRKPDDLSNVQATAASHPEFANDKERDFFRLNSIKQIGLAMHNFADIYRSFPGHANLKHGVSTNYRNAGVVVQPFSWRVAILPYLEEQELYNHYRFDEPWDSEHNRQLIDKMPAFFRSPFASESQPVGHTNIQGFATKSGLMESANGIGFASITDGSSNTILAVETAVGVPWTKPVDLTSTKVKLFEKRPLLLLLADGSVDVMAQPIDQNKLDKLITRNGGEVVPR